MITWNNLKNDIVHDNISIYTAGLSLIDTIRLVSIIDSGPLIIVSHSCSSSIYRHISSSDTELGGLLIGKVFTNPINKLPNIIVVSENIESREYDSTSVSLKINSNIWNSAREKIDKGLAVVGWYHSHPNLGAFFSGTDRRNQKYNFNHIYSVGYVIDPIRVESKWFIGPESEEVSPERVLSKG